MPSSKRADLIQLAEARATQVRKPRLVEQGPVCAWTGCRKPLVKNRPHQVCCNAACRYQAWLEKGGRRR